MRLEAGNFDPCALRCGGDRRCPFVGTVPVAACSARISCGIASRKQITRSDPNEVCPAPSRIDWAIRPQDVGESNGNYNACKNPSTRTCKHCGNRATGKYSHGICWFSKHGLA